MGGPSQSTIDAQNSAAAAQTNLANTQAATGQQYANMAQQQLGLTKQYDTFLEGFAKNSLGKMDSLTAPLISHDKNIVNAADHGNYAGLISAAGPEVGLLSKGRQQAEQQIMNNVAPGAGRDVALAQLPMQQADATAGALNKSYNQSLGQLAQIGQQYGSMGLSGAGTVIGSSGTMGLQEAGAGLSGLQGAQSGLQGAANTYSNIGQQQAAGKASSMGFLGQLAGIGGSIAGGFL